MTVHFVGLKLICHVSSHFSSAVMLYMMPDMLSITVFLDHPEDCAVISK